ncbi:LppU/SCO3897 family protein [Polymorphospora rubra]|uniref:LppU/SCO3897 family protein n=1 Tax=Polymorphospora rubra TaxID=338584 RepID=UPI0033EF2A43
MIIGLVVLLMLALCGVGVWWLLRDTDDTDSNAQPTPTVSAPVDPSGDPSGEPSPSASPSSASPSPSSDSGTFAKGDCVVNDGTADDAELRKVPCGPNTYEVLSRIPFTTDGEKCKTDPIFGDPESDANYTHDNPIDAADYVLCLKKK